MLNQPVHKRTHKGDKKYLSLMTLCVYSAIFVCFIFAGGCSVNVAGKQRPLISHSKIRGELELIVEQETDEQSERKSTTTVFEERLRLNTRGDLYHPNLLTYTAAVGLGLAQQKVDSDEESGRVSDTLKEYSFDIKLLNRKPYPMRFHADRSEDLFAREFQSSLRQESEGFGLRLALRSKEWPMQIQFDSQEITQRSLSSTTDLQERDFFNLLEERFRYSLSHAFSNTSNMIFEFDRNERSTKRSDSSVGRQDDRYRLSHSLKFGSHDQHSLRSSFNTSKVSGGTDFSQTRWVERLRLKHTDDLQTHYEFRSLESEQESFKNAEDYWEAGFKHQLYESLTTTGRVFRSEAESGEMAVTERQGGDINFNYRKKNPWGTLSASYWTSLVNTDQTGGSGIGVVIDEPHFATLEWVELDRPNIDTSGIIRVEDENGFAYDIVEDYSIMEINGRVFLVLRSFGGSFPDFGTLDGTERFFVDYNYFVEPEREEEAHQQRFHVRQNFTNGVSAYYEHSRRDESISSNVTTVTPDESRRNLFGMSYRNKGLLLLAELLEEDSTQITSTVKRLKMDYKWTIKQDMHAGIHAFRETIDFETPVTHTTTFTTYGGEISSRLTSKWSVFARIENMENEDSTSGKTTGLDLTTAFSYNYRQLSFKTGIEYDLLSRKNGETTELLLFFRLKRVF